MVPSELCKYIAESKSTITLWSKIADEQGFEALKIKDTLSENNPPNTDIMYGMEIL